MRFAIAAVRVVLGFGAIESFPGTKTMNGTEVRDWESIEPNEGGVISPEEMEKLLQATWARTKPR